MRNLNYPISLLLVAGMTFHSLRAQPLDEKYRSVRIGNTTYYGYGSHFYFPSADTFLAASGVSEYTKCHQQISRKGKVKKTSGCEHIQLDANGRVIKEWYDGGKGKNKENISYSYYPTGKLERVMYSGKKGRITDIRYSYNDSGRMTEYVLAEKGRIVELKRQYYSGQTRFLESYTYGRDTSEARFFMKSSYLNDTGKLLKTELFKGNGKLKYQWDYSCMPTGQLIPSGQKKESRICKSQTLLPNGHRQFVYEEQADGEMKRFIYEYDSADRIVMMITYGGKAGEILRGKTEITYSDQGSHEVNTYWNDKGSLRSRYTYRKNHLGQKVYGLSEYFGKNGRLGSSWQTEYIYNGTLLARMEGMSLKKPGYTSVTIWTYNFRH